LDKPFHSPFAIKRRKFSLKIQSSHEYNMEQQKSKWSFLPCCPLYIAVIVLQHL
jgi:hypothetical protein